MHLFIIKYSILKSDRIITFNFLYYIIFSLIRKVPLYIFYKKQGYFIVACHLGEFVYLCFVQTETEKEMGLLEKLTQYIKVMAELLQKELVILINIRSYLNETQINKHPMDINRHHIHLCQLYNILSDSKSPFVYFL